MGRISKQRNDIRDNCRRSVVLEFPNRHKLLLDTIRKVSWSQVNKLLKGLFVCLFV